MLGPCRECGKQISGDAEACPRCGATNPRPKGLPCPQCSGTETKELNAWSMAGASFAGAGCLMWVPIIGWVLAPLFLLAAILFALGGLVPSFGKATHYCRKCTRVFRVRRIPMGNLA